MRSSVAIRSSNSLRKTRFADFALTAAGPASGYAEPLSLENCFKLRMIHLQFITPRICTPCFEIMGLTEDMNIQPSKATVSTTPHCMHPQRCFGGKYMTTFHQCSCANAILFVTASSNSRPRHGIVKAGSEAGPAAAKRTRDYIMCGISCGAAGWCKAYFFVFRILDSTFGVSYSSFPPFFPA